MKTCPECGKGFVPYREWQVYCPGKRCAKLLSGRRHREREKERLYAERQKDVVRLYAQRWQDQRQKVRLRYRARQRRKAALRRSYRRHQLARQEAARRQHQREREEAHAARLLALALQPTGETT